MKIRSESRYLIIDIVDTLNKLRLKNLSPLVEESVSSYYQKDLEEDSDLFLEKYVLQTYDFFDRERTIHDDFNLVLTFFHEATLEILEKVDKDKIFSPISREFLIDPLKNSDSLDKIHFTTKVQTVRFFAGLPSVSHKINFSLIAQKYPELIEDENLRFLRKEDLMKVKLYYLLGLSSLEVKSTQFLFEVLKARFEELPVSELAKDLNLYSKVFFEEDNKRALEKALLVLFSSNVKKGLELEKLICEEYLPFFRNVLRKTLKSRKRTRF